MPSAVLQQVGDRLKFLLPCDLGRQERGWCLSIPDSRAVVDHLKI